MHYDEFLPEHAPRKTAWRLMRAELYAPVNRMLLACAGIKPGMTVLKLRR